ncbi:hypothetical protein S40293_05107 [Stachybotrys chartarum IBT 40293]|nr:hypothetical protein S40293_05107 [Stachybotrys chartarum IBT 40293]
MNSIKQTDQGLWRYGPEENTVASVLSGSGSGSNADDDCSAKHINFEMASQDTISTAPWHAAYPAPRHQPGSLTRDQVLQMIIKSHELGTRPDFVLIDLRRNDHEGGTIRGSINLPAQSLYPSIPALYGILKEAGVHKVIWYCSSSRGRGTRAAGWFGDYLADNNIDNGNMESLVLAEGVKGWATAGPEYLEWMDEYDSAAWQA